MFKKQRGPLTACGDQGVVLPRPGACLSSPSALQATGGSGYMGHKPASRARLAWCPAEREKGRLVT